MTTTLQTLAPLRPMARCLNSIKVVDSEGFETYVLDIALHLHVKRPRMSETLAEGI